jgi:hypothetical protein
LGLEDEAMPKIPCAVAFMDCRGLEKAYKRAFKSDATGFHPIRIAERVCDSQKWSLKKVYCYLGFLKTEQNRDLYKWWAAFGRDDSSIEVRLVPPASGKTIGLQIAEDMIAGAHEGDYDVGLVFSESKEFDAVARLILDIAQGGGREVTVAGAFPWNPRIPSQWKPKHMSLISINHEFRTGWFGPQPPVVTVPRLPGSRRTGPPHGGSSKPPT